MLRYFLGKITARYSSTFYWSIVLTKNKFTWFVWWEYVCVCAFFFQSFQKPSKDKNEEKQSRNLWYLNSDMNLLEEYHTGQEFELFSVNRYMVAQYASESYTRMRQMQFYKKKRKKTACCSEWNAGRRILEILATLKIMWKNQLHQFWFGFIWNAHDDDKTKKGANFSVICVEWTVNIINMIKSTNILRLFRNETVKHTTIRSIDRKEWWRTCNLRKRVS